MDYCPDKDTDVSSYWLDRFKEKKYFYVQYESVKCTECGSVGRIHDHNKPILCASDDPEEPCPAYHVFDSNEDLKVFLKQFGIKLSRQSKLWEFTGNKIFRSITKGV